MDNLQLFTYEQVLAEINNDVNQVFAIYFIKKKLKYAPLMLIALASFCSNHFRG